jgi:hypothetical protein
MAVVPTNQLTLSYRSEQHTDAEANEFGIG